MAISLYDGVDGVARKVTKKYDGVEAVARKVTKAYDGVDGVARQYFSSGFHTGELAVGDSVWLNVNGTLTEFLIVHQGNPDSALYDSSCDGTWLLAKNLRDNMAWDSSDSDYENSSIHAYLNGTFLGLLDSDIQSAIKQVKIPYQKGAGSSGSVSSGSSGLSTKIFLLSGYEVGWTTSNSKNLPVDGACLDYFIGTSSTDSKRIGYANGSAATWWLRSPFTAGTTQAWKINIYGTPISGAVSNGGRVRPAFVLGSSTPIDQSTGINIISY